MTIAVPTVADVRVIVTTQLDDTSVLSFIADAALIGEACLAGLSTDRQKAAVKWLTAHLIASRETTEGAGLTSDSLGDASRSWARAQLGEALSGTGYGQQAIVLAPCLSRIGKGTVSIQVI